MLRPGDALGWMDRASFDHEVVDQLLTQHIVPSSEDGVEEVELNQEVDGKKKRGTSEIQDFIFISKSFLQPDFCWDYSDLDCNLWST